MSHKCEHTIYISLNACNRYLDNKNPCKTKNTLKTRNLNMSMCVHTRTAPTYNIHMRFLIWFPLSLGHIPYNILSFHHYIQVTLCCCINVRYILTSGSLHWLSPVTGKPFPANITQAVPSLPISLCSKVSYSMKSI